MKSLFGLICSIAVAVVLGSCHEATTPSASSHFPVVVEPLSGTFHPLGSTAYPDSLAPVFPNPFNLVTGDSVINVFFSLKDTADAILLIQNPFGDSVAVFRDAHLGGGGYSGQWAPVNAAGERLREGLYFITLRVQNSAQSRDFINSELFSIEAN